VGASGGPDSTALLRCLHRLGETLELGIHVAHLNHDFRGAEADADAEFVRQLAEYLGLPFTVDRQDPMEYQRVHRISSFEQGAREMRYQFLAQVAQKVGAAAVAVGHTRDDLAETVLLHLLRGTGLHGLRGMTEVAPWPWPRGVQNLALYRPLLETAKADTTEYCQELGQDFRLDSGNFLFRFARNRVRLELMPMLAAEFNPRISEALARLARSSAQELDYLEGEVDGVWPQVLHQEREGSEIQFRRESLGQLHPYLRTLVLRRAYSRLHGDARLLEENHLRSMTDLAESGAGDSTQHLPGGLQIQTSQEYLTLSRREAEVEPVMTAPEGALTLDLPTQAGQELVTYILGWEITCRMVPAPSIEELRAADPYTAFLDRDSLPDQLQIRSRQPGDRFQPLGMDQEKSLQDFFVDIHVSRPLRDRVPLLTSPRGIVWVFGYRIADWAKVPVSGADSRPALLIRFVEAD
jgi:tRNA(Ile)-lysidine synthase